MIGPTMTDSTVMDARAFQSQRVVITGGSSGIGKALANAVVAAGGTVVLIGRSAEKLRAVAGELGPSYAATECVDVCDEEAVSDLFSRLGPFDHLATAAAGTIRGRFTDLAVTEAREMFESKFWGQYHCVKHAAPFLRPTGSVVLFSGWISRKPAIGLSTLAAIDGAVESLARVLALELAPVRVNAVTPGMIDTPLWSARLSPDEQDRHFRQVGQSLPVGRAGAADDVAQAVAFLMQNGFVTGTVLDIDGGQQ